MILPADFSLSYIPQRIISLVPSQTELLHYLQLENETVGITKFCLHPKQWYRNKIRIGGTKTLNFSTIKKLNPDLIIANKEENVKEQVEELANDFNVLVTDVNNVEDALAMIVTVGHLAGKQREAIALVEKIKQQFDKIIIPPKPIKTAYFIWNKPYMTVGGDTFISDIMRKGGFENIFENKNRYPEITVEQIKNTNCELVLLSSEPYPFKEKHVQELQTQLPGVKIVLCDGEMFSWYGSRLLLVPEYLESLQLDWSDVIGE